MSDIFKVKVDGSWTGLPKSVVFNDDQVEEAVDNYLADHPAITGTFTNEAKNLLLSLLEKVAYIDENGQAYLDALKASFAVAVSSISAVFTQGTAVIYDTDSLDSLKQYLVVTATYSDGTTADVTSYILSGSLDSATSTITVTYGGKTDTFSVSVTMWDYEWIYTDGTPIGEGFAHSTAVTGTMKTNGYEIVGSGSNGCNIITDPSTDADAGVTEVLFAVTAMPSTSGDNLGAVYLAVNKLFGLVISGSKMYYSGTAQAINMSDMTELGAAATNTDYLVRIEWNTSTGATCWINGVKAYEINSALTANRSRWFLAASTQKATAIIKAMRVKVVT